MLMTRSAIEISHASPRDQRLPTVVLKKAVLVLQEADVIVS